MGSCYSVCLNKLKKITSSLSSQSPTKGNLTKESDRVEVKRLVDELKPFMSFVKEGYEGEYKDDKRHGRGMFRYASGAVYEGE